MRSSTNVSSKPVSRLRSAPVLLAATLGLSAALAACDNPTAGKPTATVASAVPMPSTAPAGEVKPAAATEDVLYTFTQASSKVGFVGAKVTGKHDGSFGTFNGTVRLVDNNVEKSSVTVEIDTASLDSDNAKLTGHLKSADFFDVEKFPKAKFVSTSIKAGGAAGATHTVTGNLELHGVTKSITFPATIKVGDVVEVTTEFGINRKDFNIVYPGKPDDLIKDEVLIKLSIKAQKSPA
jgi:polyisoprenoid-binding protein YceI